MASRGPWSSLVVLATVLAACSGDHLTLLLVPVDPIGADVQDYGFIFLADSDGSNPRPFVEGERPQWSPDGSRIAFHRPSPEKLREGDIYVIGVDGSQQVALGEGIEPAWSPGGDLIAFTSSEGIAVMKEDGSAVRTLVRHDFRDQANPVSDLGVGKPAWSPDGQRIAFEHLGDGDVLPAQIFVVDVIDVDGSEPRRLTPTEGRQGTESDPVWAADGSSIVFWSYGYGIADADARGGAPTPLFDFPGLGYDCNPAWSSEGVLTFTARVDGGAQIWAETGEALIANARDAVWSPDGQKVVFVAPLLG